MYLGCDRILTFTTDLASQNMLKICYQGHHLERRGGRGWKGLWTPKYLWL